MGDVLKFDRGTDCIATLEGALNYAKSTEPCGVVVALVNEDGGLYVTYNESMGAENAIAICEMVKSMNVDVLLYGED